MARIAKHTENGITTPQRGLKPRDVPRVRTQSKHRKNAQFYIVCAIRETL